MCPYHVECVEVSSWGVRVSHSICSLPSGICPRRYLSFLHFLLSDCTIPILPKRTLDYIWSYLARKPVLLFWNRSDEVSWTLSMLRGTQEVLAERGQRWRSPHPDCAPAVTSGPTGESPETWIDFFEWERKRNFRYLLTSLDGMCHRRGQRWTERKSQRQTANVISGRDKRCLFKSATVQLPLRTLLSHPSDCELPNSTAFVPLMSRKLYFYCDHSPCVKTLCFPATSHKEGAAALYISINECFYISLKTVQWKCVSCCCLSALLQTAAAAGLMIY